jgi:hypothetical protein
MINSWEEVKMNDVTGRGKERLEENPLRKGRKDVQMEIAQITGNAMIVLTGLGLEMTESFILC